MLQYPPISTDRLARLGLSVMQRLTTLLAPPVCALCQGDGQTVDELWGIDLCIHCEAACQRIDNPCQQCGEPLAGVDCQHCSGQMLPYDAVHALYLYANPADQMITRLKFGQDLMYGRVLGTLLARSLHKRNLPLPDCLVPMPLHPNRYIERGFNQSAEIARHTAWRIDIPLNRHLLQRCRATLPQSGLDSTARRNNMTGAFRVTAGCKMPAHVALLDDVLTTGNTAAAAARALKGSGCQRVEVWACARASRHLPIMANRR